MAALAVASAASAALALGFGTLHGHSPATLAHPLGAGREAPRPSCENAKAAARAPHLTCAIRLGHSQARAGAVASAAPLAPEPAPASEAAAEQVEPAKQGEPSAEVEAAVTAPQQGAAPVAAAPTAPTAPTTAGISNAAPTPSPEPAPPAPPPLYASSMESSSFDGWHLQALPERVTLSTADPFEGAASTRFEVRPGDVEPETGSNRAEVSGPTFNEGDDLFIRDAIRVPTANTFSGSWQIIQQLHETDWGGSPGIAVFLDGDRTIHLGAGDGSPSFWQGPQLQNDRWYDLVYHVHLSQEPSEGFVEIWLDGQQQTLPNSATRAYGQTIQTAQTYLKAGIYRSAGSAGTSVVEHDDIVVGTSLAAVLGA